VKDVAEGLARWHAVLEARDPAGVPGLLAQDAVFRSPALFAPQEGRDVVAAYLGAAMTVLGPEFRYHREWTGPDSAVLEFTSEVSGREIHGIDMITWDDAGQITDFTVMVRPFSALQALMQAMVPALAEGRHA
jgi:SnoaL-like domain